MDYETVVRLTSEALLMVLMISLPVVVVAASVGLMVSFVQAITSLQDQSISQGAKLVAVTITLVIAAPWGASAVLRFAESVFKAALA
jgi:type III secretion protein S